MVPTPSVQTNMTDSLSLPFDPDLFDLLVCPQDRVPLKWVEGSLLSTAATGRRRYRVENDIPVMLVEDSQVVEPDEWQRLMAAPGPIGGGPDAVRARHASAPG